MNCQTARQTFELVRPEEVAIPAIGDAETHVRGCPECQDAVREQQRLDVQIGRICRDVPIPKGLKDRLLAGIFATDPADANVSTRPDAFADAAGKEVRPGAVAENLPAVSVRRRRLAHLVVGTTVACVLITAGAVSWFLRLPAATLTRDGLTAQALEADPKTMTAFQSFRRGLALRKPATMDSSVLKDVPRQLGDQDVAVYFFVIRRGRTLYQGQLIVVPAASLIDPPTATGFPGQPLYKPPFCTTAWVEGELAFVCVVKGDESVLNLLQRHTV